jgi:hypothetical protein
MACTSKAARQAAKLVQSATLAGTEGQAAKSAAMSLAQQENSFRHHAAASAVEICEVVALGPSRATEPALPADAVPADAVLEDPPAAAEDPPLGDPPLVAAAPADPSELCALEPQPSAISATHAQHRIRRGYSESSQVGVEMRSTRGLRVSWSDSVWRSLGTLQSDEFRLPRRSNLLFGFPT